MFYINEGVELNKFLLNKIINKFISYERPQLRKWGNYYNGIHAILSKYYIDETKECNHIITNYCKIITDTYAGYICGKPVSYTSNDDISEIQDIINYNDSPAEDISFLTNALVFGQSYELFWLDKDAQVRYSQISPLNGFPIYSNSLDKELLYFVRWYDADNFDDTNRAIIEVYSANDITVYSSSGIGGELELIETKPHYFQDVPVSVFNLNESRKSIFDSIMSLNDAYNELQSSEIDDFNAWVDAYLLISNADATQDSIRAMKEDRVLILPEGATASWLTKNSNDTQIVNMLDNIKKNIFKVSAAPDMADDNFLAQSGTALAYKLVGFENVASGIVANMTKAIQRRIELICNILNLKATETIWRDIKIVFTRNLPVNTAEQIELVNKLTGIVSNKTLLSQLSFVSDVEAETEAINEEKQNNISLYDFAPKEEKVNE